MRDGKALQAATSHYLGQGFARTYGVRFTDRDGEEQHAYATSWGASTRLVGGVIMTHGDDRGLRLPPAVAPYQVVVVPIAGRAAASARVVDASRGVVERLRGAGVRVHLDDRAEHRPGFKFHEWELRGVPLRLEVGPRDLDEQRFPVVRRDTGERELVPVEGVVERVGELLATVQERLLAEARAFRAAHTLEDPAGYAELVEFLGATGGLAVAWWCGAAACEERVKADARATIRCVTLEPVAPAGRCVVCARPGVERATWAQAY
jgi:prolyl-tRNA synthetase